MGSRMFSDLVAHIENDPRRRSRVDALELMSASVPCLSGRSAERANRAHRYCPLRAQTAESNTRPVLVTDRHIIAAAGNLHLVVDYPPGAHRGWWSQLAWVSEVVVWFRCWAATTRVASVCARPGLTPP